MQKTLKEKCIFVKGAKNAAIYDLVNQKVYALNDIGKLIVEKFLADSSKLDTKSIEYIDKLDELGLIELVDATNCDKWHPSYQDCQLNFAWLELTGRCNLHCIHCYGQFGSSITNFKNAENMTTNDWKRIIRELKANNCKSIQFIGGEPLCCSEFQEILTYANDIGMERIGIFTNGTLVNENLIRLIKESNSNVRISLYGHNAQTHESVTGIKGSFHKTENALKLLKKYEIPTKVSVIIMKVNQSHVDQIKEYIESLGHKYHGYDTIRQVAGNVNSDNCVTDTEILKRRYRCAADFSVSETQYVHNLHWNNCWSGEVAITACGDVLPCIFTRDTVIGNVLVEPFSAVLSKALPHWSLTLDQVETCKDCEYRYACHNCRPIAMSIGGELHSNNPRCCYDPYKGVWRDITDFSKELNIFHDDGFKTSTASVIL